MHDTGCLGLVHWDDPEGWYGEGGGRGFQDVLPNSCTYVLPLGRDLHVLLCEGVLTFFLKYKFIYFSWRLITLQYWIGFAIHQHESAMGV